MEIDVGEDYCRCYRCGEWSKGKPCRYCSDAALRALIAEMRRAVDNTHSLDIEAQWVRDWADRLAALLPKE